MISSRDSRSAAGLVEQTAGILRQQIVQGVYGDDGELPAQAELSDQLGVSRLVVREAMQRLQSQRLIVLGQGRKPRVVPAGASALADSLQTVFDRTDANWAQLGEVRRTLEVEIAELAAERSHAKHWHEMEKSIAAMLATDDVGQQVEADMKFHRILAEASGNPVFVFLLDALATLLRASRERTIGLGGAEPAVRGHRAILDAVRRHHRKAARQAMTEHLQESQRDLAESSKAVD